MDRFGFPEEKHHLQLRNDPLQINDAASNFVCLVQRRSSPIVLALQVFCTALAQDYLILTAALPFTKTPFSCARA